MLCGARMGRLGKLQEMIKNGIKFLRNKTKERGENRGNDR